MDTLPSAHHVLLHAWDDPAQESWAYLFRRTRSSSDSACCADNVGVASDLVCKLDCKSGYAEVAGLANKEPLPLPGIFAPPYAINVGLAQIPIIIKVCCSHFVEGMQRCTLSAASVKASSVRVNDALWRLCSAQGKSADSSSQASACVKDLEAKGENRC
jgi:hypothetical protein